MVWLSSTQAFEWVFVRHGHPRDHGAQCCVGQSREPLTDLGREQARSTGARLVCLGGIGAVVASDQPRALETARLVADALGLTVQSTSALRECSLGVLTGMPLTEAETRYPEVFYALRRDDPHVRPPGGETGEECAARALAHLSRLESELRAERVVVVSHARAISFVLRALLPDLPKRATRRVDYCSLHRVARGPDGRFEVRALNDVDHLLVDAGRAPGAT